MKIEIKLSTLEWLSFIPKAEIIDPDAWDRTDINWYKEVLTWNEFMERCSASTTNGFNFDGLKVRDIVAENFRKYLFGDA